MRRAQDPILVPDYQEPNPTPAPPEAPKLPGVVAKAYIVVDAATGAVLAEHQAHQRRPVASLTKIMTALLVLEQARLDEVVTVDDAISRLSRYSTVMGVVPGEQLTVRDLLYGMMLSSGNDAALALAIHVGGAESAFVGMMNERADGLGMRNTHFANAHGLDSRRGGHYSSAYDLSLLTRVAMENAIFREIVGTYSWSAQGLLQPYGMYNRNSLINTYAGADGVKIGYTRRAGQTIVGSAVRKDTRLLAVALGSTQSITDAIRLLDFGFQQPP